MFFLRRILLSAVTLLVASMVIFVITNVLPSDPAELILGINAQEDTLRALRKSMGLDQPLYTQYLQWIIGIMGGDFGTSYTYAVPVSELIGERLWISLPLAVLSLFLSTLIAIPVGVIAAARHNKITDMSIMSITQLGIALPNFWFAMLLVFIFAIQLQWLPAGGFAGWENGLLDGLQSLILPAIALALPQASILSRIMRSSLLDVLKEDYMRTAHAKGLPYKTVLWVHGVRNALIPVLTILGLQFSFLIAGTIIIENIFYLPGLGRLIFQSIAGRDLIVLQGLVLILVSAVIFINLLVDVAYAIVDPRIKRAYYG